MSDYKSEFLRTLHRRGFIHQTSDAAGLDQLASERRVIAYVGYDCTGPSLHVGHLISIMMLYWLQDSGNKPIVLMGGGTTRVGDPSGRDETRSLLTYEQINSNKESIKRTFSNFVHFGSGSSDAIMADNAEWLTRLNYIEMLREVGRHFSINRMLKMDSVKLRLDREQELSFIEFNYMILQSYDFVELARRYDCNLQMGGSDQWGNITNGMELGRRMGTHQLYALTCNLLTTASGAKMGKTATGAVWLNKDMLSVHDYWQFWRNTEDDDVVRFLKLFTKVSLRDINEMRDLSDFDIVKAKKLLANEATALIHGRDAANQAARTAELTFERGGLGEGLPSLFVKFGDGILSANTSLGFSTSNSHARSLVSSGAVYLGDRKITDPHYRLGPADFDPSGRALLKTGSRKRAILIRKED